jgi:long-subunit fatty acid transport protein
MNAIKRYSFVSVAVLILESAASAVYAQFPEDALRISSQGVTIGARSLGMGNAYTGISNDLTALYFNPAGLSQMELSEISIGLSHFNTADAGTFAGTTGDFSTGKSGLSHLGIVYSAPVQRGGLAVGFSYFRQNNFTSGLTFSGFNPNSSIVQSWAPNGQPYPPDITIAEELGLAIADTSTGRFISPITGMMTQTGTVIEGGGMDNYSFGGAIDVARGLSVGGTLTILSGRYEYDRDYSEVDSENLYQTFPFDVTRFDVREYIRGDISGIGGNLGLMYRIPGWLRLGITARTPSHYSVEENYGQSADSYFDNGDILPVDGSYVAEGFGKYDVVSPWSFSGGLSLILWNLVLSGDVQFTDWTQLRFSNANAEVLALNKEISRVFRPASNLRVGAEWNPLGLGLRFRGGAMYFQSPYAQDTSNDNDQKYLTAGLGIPLGSLAMLDLAYAYGWWTTTRSNYDPTSVVQEDIVTQTVLLSFSFRF